MNRRDLEPLLTRPERSTTSVLSVYLNAGPPGLPGLNAAFETKLKEMTATLRESIIDPSELELFLSAIGRVHDIVHWSRFHSPTIAIFLDEADGFFWSREFKMPVM